VRPRSRRNDQTPRSRDVWSADMMTQLDLSSGLTPVPARSGARG
jgi:hypothetical protein